MLTLILMVSIVMLTTAAVLSLFMMRYKDFRVTGAMFAAAFVAMAAIRIVALFKFFPHLDFEPDVNVQAVTVIALAMLIASLVYLKKKHDEIDELERQRDNLQRLIVHDLQNPLTGVMLAVDALKETASEKLSEQQALLLRSAWFLSKRLKNMISNLNDINKLEEVKTALNLTAFSAGELLEEFDWMAEYANRSGKTLLISADNDLKIVADKPLLVRIIENLISNSIKYSDKGVSIRLSISRGDNGVRFEVADDGQGIPKMDMEKLFKKYSRIATRKGEGLTGTGLGLYFCKLAVDLHGGRIGVESRPGNGTRFYFNLPQPG